jgi:hypothetical protein
VFPDICENLNTDHGPLIQVYRKARALPGIKKILIGSGVRYDLAVKSPEYVKELVTHHVGGYLKIAPEHTEDGPLQHMMKPGMGAYDRFKQLFEKYSAEAGKEQYLIPYFIAAHPGTTNEDMLNLALWLKRNKFRLDQVQTFLPTPMAMATTMYHSELNPLRKVLRGGQSVAVTKQGRVRKLHKAFLRYHDPENWPMLREALKEMGREELIGNGKHHLIPSFQPAGTGRWFEPSPAAKTEGTRKPEREERAYIHSPPSVRSKPDATKPKATPRNERIGKDATRGPRAAEADAPPPRRGAGRGMKPGGRPEFSPAGNGRKTRGEGKPRK